MARRLGDNFQNWGRTVAAFQRLNYVFRLARRRQTPPFYEALNQF